MSNESRSSDAPRPASRLGALIVAATLALAPAPSEAIAPVLLMLVKQIARDVAESMLENAILSKDLLHHLPDPMVLWSEARRLGRSGTAIYVMDLMRPESPEAAHDIVESVARDELPILKADFYASLCAAFTLEETKAQVKRSGLPLEVTQVTDRHMVIKGMLV